MQKKVWVKFDWNSKIISSLTL